MRPRTSGGTPAPTRRSGLLFPGGPTRRDRRPLMLGLLIIAAAGLWFVNSRGEDVPPPVAIIASKPVVPGAASVTRRSAGGTVPTTWEELTAARAAAMRARAPAPAAPPAEVEEDEGDDEPAAPRRARREPPRRRVVEREEQPPPPATEPAPPAAPSGEPGRLSVNAIPWGQLIVDGRIYGNTPRLNMPIAVGTRRIRIAREGFAPFDTTITVEPGESIRLTGITLRAEP